MLIKDCVIKRFCSSNIGPSILEIIEFSKASLTVLRVDQDIKWKLLENRGHLCLTVGSDGVTGGRYSKCLNDEILMKAVFSLISETSYNLDMKQDPHMGKGSQ